jgi:hypothetical protein
MSTSSFGTPIIDSIASGRQLAQVLMNNIVQRIQLSDGKGVTEKFSGNVFTDEIRIIRIKPLVQKGRTLAASTNGAHYATNGATGEQPTTDHYGIRLRHKVDVPVSVPQSSMDMIPLDLLNGTVKVLEQTVANAVNASTLATQLAAALNYEYNSGVPLEDHKIEVTLGTDSIVDAIIDMNAILDDGDTANGIHTFPLETRVLQMRPSAKKYLKRGLDYVYQVNNWKGQDMLKVGALDPVNVPNTHVDGYQGEVDMVDLFLTPSAIWTLAEEWLGLTAADLDDVYGLMSASEATGRGIAFTNAVQVIPEYRGQGVRYLPNYRWGLEVFFDKGLVLLAKAALVSIGTGSLTAIAPDSR